MTITGTGFIYPSNVICRFGFSTSSVSVDIMGEVRSATSIICTVPRHLGTDLSISLSVSFNKADYYDVTTSTGYISYNQKARVYSITPTYVFADQYLSYNTSMTVTGTTFSDKNLAQFGNFTYSRSFTSTSSTTGTLTIPTIGNVSAADNTTAYGDNRIVVEIGNSVVGFSRDEITLNYINHFTIDDMTPELVNADGDTLYFTGTGFINTTALNCKFGTYLATSAYYYNQTKIACKTPAISDQTGSYGISITLNGIEYIDFIDSSTNLTKTLLFTADIDVVSIDPNVAFDS